ncbi:MAG TPA: beta-N-acetylhexosaminidase [Bacillales bacterium]|nr:beta-N-acetylhexosaminidase [Bacillales bacterium]
MLHLSDLTLEEKIGQMVMCGFQGKVPSEGIRRMIHEQRIGGVIYFSRNVESPKQVHQLSYELQEYARENNGIPLFIGIDQEGGMVARITDGITLMPGNMALGAVGDVQDVQRASEISGIELRALGINMNFAPSVDINNNPNNPVIGVRSFGDDPIQVSELGIAAVRGYQKADISAAVKHFPGHGDTADDSHFALPQIPHGRERVREVELVPFKKAIDHGVDMVMTAHIVFPAFDESGNPGTLSSNVVRGLLRNELGYKGVVITDCLEMDAVSETFGTEKAAVMAIEAGADIALVSHREDRQIGAIREIMNAVKNGRISEKRIDESVGRILELKKRRNLEGDSVSWEEAKETIFLKENRDFVQKLSEKSITVVKDENEQIPLDRSKRTFVICPELQALNAADESVDQGESLGDFLSEMMDAVTERKIHADPTEEEIERVLYESDSFDQVVVVTYNSSIFRKQVDLVRDLLVRRRDSLVAVAIRNPFDFLEFPEVPVQVAAYESRPLALKSTAKVLTGSIQAHGKLPVRL